MAESLNIEIEPFKYNDFEYSEYDREKEINLSKEVWERSLLLDTVQNLLGATDEVTIWKETAQGLQILFELTTILFFAYDPENNGLRGVTLPDADKSAMIKDMIVPMEQEESLLTECLRTRKITNSFSRSTEPAPCESDKQIIRILEKEGLVCIPMVAYGEKIGAIALGLDLMELSSLESQVKLLQMLADQAAIAIRVHHLGQARLQKIQSKRVSAFSPSSNKNADGSNKPFGIIKKYLKMPWRKIDSPAQIP
jgi:GAF domain-containing protein